MKDTINRSGANSLAGVARATGVASATGGPSGPPDDKRQFMLAALRRASLSLQATAAELNEIGVSLRCNMINAEDAVTWLDHIGALHCINLPPWNNRAEAA